MRELISVQFNKDIHSMATSLASSRAHISFWSEMIEKFIRNYTSFETQKAYLSDLKQFFSWADKKRISDFEDISFKKAIEYRDYLKSFSGRVVKGELLEASHATVDRKISALSSFFEFVSKDVLEKTQRHMPNPFKRVTRFKVDSSVTVTEALVKEELAKLMNHVDTLESTLINLRDRAIIKTLFGVVTRNKAFINLKGKDFYAIGDRFRLKYIDKGDKAFDEVLHPATAQAIIDYLEIMKIQGEEVLDEDPLFRPIHAKKHFSVNQITNILKKHCKMADIGDWVTSHSAKATVTSELVERYGVHLAQRKTKHKRTDQVVAYYGKRRERETAVFDQLDYLSTKDI